MPDELDTVLRLVADGHLTPEEAAPIIEALTARRAEPSSGRLEGQVDAIGERVRAAHERAQAVRDDARGLREGLRGRQIRIRVTEHGRQVVNLRIPIGFVDAALRMVPGLAGDQATRIRQAVDEGVVGPILDVEDGGDSVLISVE